jgi:hypothetical protein
MERELPADVRNVVYGHAVTDAGQPAATLDGDVWLQYWYFYIYNDAQFGGRSDLHEGDVEMVQFLLRDGEPVTAVYAQHAYAEQRRFAELERDAAHGCPVVYSGRGSHASYFEAGLQRTHVKVGDHYPPLYWDAADGNGPHIRQRLITLSDDALPGWAQWRGRWGGTRPRIPLLDGESPGGPITHGQWSKPAGLAAGAIQHDTQPLPGPAPVTVSRAGAHLQVQFDFGALADPPDRIVLTVSAPDQPPITETLVVDALSVGTIVTRRSFDSQIAYAVAVSTISVSGVPSQPPPPTQLAALPDIGPGRTEATLLNGWDRLWQRVGALGDRPRGR